VTATGTSSRLGHKPALDGLRAVAVLLVMAHHLRAFALPDARWLPPGGYLGVDLFFVLSGFLITSLLLEERDATGRIAFRSFYRRRAFRLFPAVAAFVVVQAAAALVAGQSITDEVHFWFGAFTYTSNWVMAANWSVPANTGHMWSLAVEEQFYVVWPIVLLLAVRRWGARVLPWLAGAGVTIAIAARVYLTHRFGSGYPFVYLHTETRVDALLLGAGLAWLVRHGRVPSPSTARAVGWIGAVALAGFVLYTNPTDAFLYTSAGYTVLALAATMLLLGLLDEHFALTRVLSTRPLVAIGRLSYSLYLWHMLVLFIALSFLQHHDAVVATTAYLVASFALASISYRFVEHPLREFGRRPLRRRARTDVPHRRVVPAFAAAGAGAVVLTLLTVAPAYARRHDIVARDRAVAAAVAAEHAGSPLADTPPGATPVDANAGPDTSGATPDQVPIAPAAPVIAPSPDGGAPPTTLTRRTVTLTLAAPALGTDPVTRAVVLLATLRDADGNGVAARTIHFATEVGACDGVTDTAGVASCRVAVGAVTPSTDPAAATVHAVYDGDASTTPASAAWPV